MVVDSMSLRWLCLIALSALASPASAQPRTLAELAAYRGADRMQILTEGAKKEGALTIYTSLVARDLTPIVNAFKKKYPLDVQVWRGSTEAIVQRTLNEARTGRCPADIQMSGPPAVEPLRREGLLQAVKSPATADLIPQAVPAHGEYVGVYLNIFAAAYNTNLVKADELPTSYEDLKDPRWKGRLAVEADDSPWFAALAATLGEDRVVALFREIVRINGISPRKGHTVLANMVAAGEVPLALTVFSYKSDQLAASGAPIRTFYLPPVIALASAVAVGRCATHPHAALLFHDFMATDAQAIMAKGGLPPANPKIKPLPAGINLTFMDPAQMIDEGRKWNGLWEHTITKPQ
jgi:iron(III) transport system substrate-binding protein